MCPQGGLFTGKSFFPCLSVSQSVCLPFASFGHRARRNYHRPSPSQAPTITATTNWAAIAAEALLAVVVVVSIYQWWRLPPETVPINSWKYCLKKTILIFSAILAKRAISISISISIFISPNLRGFGCLVITARALFDMYIAGCSQCNNSAAYGIQ